MQITNDMLNKAKLPNCQHVDGNGKCGWALGLRCQPMVNELASELGNRNCNRMSHSLSCWVNRTPSSMKVLECGWVGGARAGAEGWQQLRKCVQKTSTGASSFGSPAIYWVPQFAVLFSPSFIAPLMCRCFTFNFRIAQLLAPSRQCQLRAALYANRNVQMQLEFVVLCCVVMASKPKVMQLWSRRQAQQKYVGVNVVYPATDTERDTATTATTTTSPGLSSSSSFSFNSSSLSLAPYPGAATSWVLLLLPLANKCLAGKRCQSSLCNNLQLTAEK